jgi:spermidine synthase
MDQLTEKTIYRDSWNKCRIEIIEDGDNRSLYFGGNVLQSTMSISTPQRLVLSYTRYMMTTLLFVRALQRVLVVGVGAGSLIRFIHHHCPDCIIDGVDSSARILQLARGYFNLPDSGGVRLHCCDGREFLADRKNQGYDLVLVDAFDQEGMAASIYCAEFFSQCRNHLQKNGIISLNLWSGDTARLNQVQSDLERHYNSCYTMPVPDRGNIVCLAAKESDLKMTMERDYTELARMGAEFDINFNEISRVFNKHNLGYRERLFRFFC